MLYVKEEAQTKTVRRWQKVVGMKEGRKSVGALESRDHGRRLHQARSWQGYSRGLGVSKARPMEGLL